MNNNLLNLNDYNNILKLAEESKDSNKKYLHVCDEISRDINRTFYTEKFKNGNGNEILNNIFFIIYHFLFFPKHCT